MAVKNTAGNGSEVETHKVFCPCVGVLVTADVKVIQYGSSPSLGPTGGGKCEIITNLNAIVKEISDTNDSSTFLSTDLSKEVSEQPLVRRSKKNTQLNNISGFYSSYGKKKIEIERMVILPKVGCTIGDKTFRSRRNRLPVRKSKSWDTVRKPLTKLKDPRFLKSQSMHVISDETTRVYFKNMHMINESLEKLDILHNEDLTFDDSSFKSEYDSEKEIVMILKAPSDYKTSQMDSDFPTPKMIKKGGQTKNVAQAKATRNVSILHKPKTRDKFTSTTTLTNGTSLYKQLNSSLKELLMPYSLIGKEYPSEIILKLTPKKEVLKYIQNYTSADQCNVDDFSEMNLLAPKLKAVKNKEKKQSGLLSCLCFSRKKKGGDDDSIIAESLNSSTKEVYFPSVVEVYDSEKKPIKEFSSVLTVNMSNISNNKHLKQKNK